MIKFRKASSFVVIFIVSIIFGPNIYGQNDSINFYTKNGMNFNYKNNIILQEVDYNVPNAISVLLTKEQNIGDYGYPLSTMEIVKLTNDSLKNDFEQFFHTEYKDAKGYRDRCLQQVKNNEENFFAFLTMLEQRKGINLSFKNIDDEMIISEIETKDIKENHRVIFYTLSVSPIMSLIAMGDNDGHLVYMETKRYLIKYDNILYSIVIKYIGEDSYTNDFESVLSSANFLNK